MARLQMLCLLVLWLSMIKGQKADFEVRLVDGKTPHDGRVEIRKDKSYWRTVCNYVTWDLPQANVVCHMLNYTKAVSIGTTDITNLYPFHIYPYYLVCNGYETSIGQCNQYYHSGISVICDHYRNSSTVVCGNLTTEEKAIKVRLVGSSISHVGQVEIQYKGTWGGVCKWYWDIKDAHVICRMLGYKAAEGEFNIEGESTTKMLMSGVACSGKEKSIAECYHNGWYIVRSEVYLHCSYKHLAGVVCQVDGEPPPVRQVRLAGGTSPNSGRVEVSYNGSWVGVCDENVAKVVCHMLGYRGVHTVKHSNPGAKSKFWLYRYGCSGEEMSISNCSGQWGWLQSRWCNEDVTCTTVSQPRIAASEALPCTAELTINSTTNTDIENKLIQFYDIQLINKHNKASFSLLVAGSVSNFTIGDGKYYNGTYNAPLEPGSTYNITVRAVTRTYDEGNTYGETNLIVFTTSLCTKGLSSAALQIKTSLMLSIVCSFLSLFR